MTRWFKARGAIIVICLGIAFDMPTDAYAKKYDPLDDVLPSLIGENIGRSIATMLEAAAGMKAAAEEANAQIQSARSEFWRQYPSGPNFAAAQEEFARLLMQKDLHYLMLAFMNWGEQGRDSGRGAGHVLEKIGGQIDNGISNYALPEFERWVEAVMENFKREEKEGKDFVTLRLTFLSTAIQAAPKEYQIYQFARDWGEFDAANREPEWVQTPQGYAFYLITRYGQQSPVEARKLYLEMLETFGKRHVDHVAMKIRKAGIGKAGQSSDQGQVDLVKDLEFLHLFPHEFCYVPGRSDHLPMSCKEPIPPGRLYVWSGHVRNVFNTLLGAGNLKNYVMGLQYWKLAKQAHDATGKAWWGWKAPTKFYHQLVEAYGEEAVHRVAKRILKEPKAKDGGHLMNPKSLQVGSSWAIDGLEELLAQQNPEAFIRLAVGSVVKSKKHDAAGEICWVDTVYASLAQDLKTSLSATPSFQEKQALVFKYQERIPVSEQKRIIQGVQNCIENSIKSASSAKKDPYEELVDQYGKDKLIKLGNVVLEFWRSPATCRGKIDSRAFMDGRSHWLYYSGSLLKENIGHSTDGKIEKDIPLIENPGFRAWSQYNPGATATISLRGMHYHDGTYLLSLESVDLKNRTLEIGFSPIAEPQRKTVREISETIEKSANYLNPGWAKTLAEGLSSFNFATTLALLKREDSRPIRKQTLTIAGNPIDSDVYLLNNMQVWASELVPGGVARIVLNEGKSEFLVKGFSGELTKGDPSKKDFVSMKMAPYLLTCNFADSQ